MLTEAITKTLVQPETQSGLTHFDLAVSNLLNNKNKDRQLVINELLDSVGRADLSNDPFWYFVALAAERLALIDPIVAARIQSRLSEENGKQYPVGRYHALVALGHATGHGVLPEHLRAENDMRSKKPDLWLALFLKAYQNGNPEIIRLNLTKLVEGRRPIINWKGIRARLPDIRRALGDVPTFRKVMRSVAQSLTAADAKRALLKAVDQRVGGELEMEVVRQSTSSRSIKDTPRFPIRKKVLIQEKKFQERQIEPVAA